MKITYFGHSTYQIEAAGVTLLVDPFIAENPHTEVDPDTLEPDVILVSHAHFDHIADAPDIASRTGAEVISNFEITQWFANEHGHENNTVVNEGGKLRFDWGSVEAVHARHTSSFPDGSYGGVPNGHIIHIEDTCIYNAGDTAPFAEMEWIGEEHSVDLAALPIGGVLTMGMSGAIKAADLVNADTILPVHYDTFPNIKVDLDDWEQRCDEAGFQTQTVPPGESFEL